jgi:hypothetical protein
MARARNIKPSFFTNEILGQLDPIIGMTFVGLWCLADRDGRLEDRPLRIKAELFPYRESLDVNGYLTVLERHGFLTRYEVDGVRYIEITNFVKHQNPHHTEKPKGYPCKPAPVLDNRDLTVKELLANGENKVPERSDSLIPDSLIPDSLNHERGIMKEETKKATRDKPARFDPLAIELPECLNPSAWESWIEYRRSRKLTCAEPTMHAQLKNLESWWHDGHDPSAIIQSSISNGWQGLFAPKGNAPPTSKKPAMTNDEIVDMIFAQQGRLESDE